MKVSAKEVLFELGSAMSVLPEYQQLSGVQRKLWVDVKLQMDLGHQPLCD